MGRYNFSCRELFSVGSFFSMLTSRFFFFIFLSYFYPIFQEMLELLTNTFVFGFVGCFPNCHYCRFMMQIRKKLNKHSLSQKVYKENVNTILTTYLTLQVTQTFESFQCRFSTNIIVGDLKAVVFETSFVISTCTLLRLSYYFCNH